VSGEALGRRLLLLDAAYCLGAGALAIVLADPLARLFAAPATLLVALGAATAAWAACVAMLARRGEWRRSVATVAVANALGALAIAALALVAPALAARLLLAAIAVEVAAFAAAQLVALRRA
jgi:hypothetical protein